MTLQRLWLGRMSTLVLAVMTLGSIAGGAVGAGEARTVEITASRFRFEPSVVEVDKGQSVRLILRSADTDHGLAIKAYGVKVAIPKGGAPVSVDLVATQAGRFPMECSEYCGSGHSRMRGELVVVEVKS